MAMNLIMKRKLTLLGICTNNQKSRSKINSKNIKGVYK